MEEDKKKKGTIKTDKWEDDIRLRRSRYIFTKESTEKKKTQEATTEENVVKHRRKYMQDDIM